MNGYICFYKDKRIEVYAHTKEEARASIAQQYKVKNKYDITVYLAEINGEAYIHSTCEI